MSKEAMKLALKALEAHADIGIKSDKAITALREALAEQPAPMIRGDIRDGLVDDEPAQQEPIRVPVTDNTYNYAKSLAEAIFKQHFASDEHYSSGRIVWGVNDTVIGILTQIDNMVADMVRKPAQQEPVAWMDGYRNIYSLEEKAAGCSEATIALVPMANHKKTSGSPIKELNCICGAVWEGDELVHLPRPPAQREWVGLTKQEFNECVDGLEDLEDCWTAIEAKLMEKNT